MQQLIFVQAGGSRYDPQTSVCIHARPNAVYVINSPRGLGSVDTALQSAAAAGLNGEYLQGVQLTARTVSDTITVRGKNRKEMYAARMELIRICNPLRGVGTLIYSNDAGEWEIPAIASVYGEAAERYAKSACKVSVAFKCPDPFWRETHQTTLSLYIYKRGDPFPLQMPATLRNVFSRTIAVNAGDETVRPIVTVTGPLLGLSIQNTTTGACLNFPTLRLLAGETAEIDCQAQDSVKMRSDGTKQRVVPSSGFEYIDLPIGTSGIHTGVLWADEGATVTARFAKLRAGV